MPLALIAWCVAGMFAGETRTVIWSLLIGLLLVDSASVVVSVSLVREVWSRRGIMSLGTEVGAGKTFSG